jgi:hypothetical protein
MLLAVSNDSLEKYELMYSFFWSQSVNNRKNKYGIKSRLNTLKEVKVKSKGHPRKGHEDPESRIDVVHSSFLNLGAKWGWVIKAMPRSLYSRERDAVPILQRADWVPELVWTSAENVTPTEIQSPDRPSYSLVDNPTTLSRSTPLNISIIEIFVARN